MKVTQRDIDLAAKFPKNAGIYGQGISLAEARISPADLKRLLALNLIRVARRWGMDCSHSNNLAAGTFLRHTDTFVRS